MKALVDGSFSCKDAGITGATAIGDAAACGAALLPSPLNVANVVPTGTFCPG
jgi:hypothetical protein